MEIETCEICTEPYDRNRTKIVCPCSKIACIECYKRYITESLGDTIECMFCHLKLADIHSIFPKKFQIFFKDHCEKIWLAKEKTYLHTAQPLAEKMIRINAVTTRLREIRPVCKKDKDNFLNHEKRNLTQELKTLRGEKERKIPAVHSCPVNDCRGFLDEKWQCGICGQQSCDKCGSVIGENHICNPNDVASVREIRKHTKACPNCNIPIHRISGCNQMWCVKCHTAFDYITGKAVHGPVHNPHFFAWRNETKQQVPIQIDVPCGGLPQNLPDIDFRTKFLLILRLALHMQGKPVPTETNPVRNRVKYLMGTITEDQWKKSIYLGKTKYVKLLAFYELDRMFVLASSDLFRRVLQPSAIDEGKTVKEKRLGLLGEFERLREYYNTQAKKISEKYNCGYCVIYNTWFESEPIKAGKVHNEPETGKLVCIIM